MRTQKLGLAILRVEKVGSGELPKHLRYYNGMWPFKTWLTNFLTFKFILLDFHGYYTSNTDIKFMQDILTLCKICTANRCL